MKGFSTFLIALAFIAGMVGCGEVTPPAPSRYDLTMAVAPGGGGTAADLTNALPYAEGTSVSMRATANPGYDFVNWTAPAGRLTNVGWPQATFTMPAQNVTVTANFVRVYDLTMAANPVGQGTATDLTNASPYAEGTSVKIRAVAAAGYHFVSWEASAGAFGNATEAQTTFVMPAQDAAVAANFAVDLYFWADAKLALRGPATSPPGERDPWVSLDICTNIVMDSVRVDLPDGRFVIAPPYGDAFGPGVNGRTELRFCINVAGMPIAGGEYIFTGLDMAGEPIPGATGTDIWVGVEPPAPPTNIRAELTEDGILVSWDESPIIPGSFEPAAVPQLGWYQLDIRNIETGTMVYGASQISASTHLVPQDKADFIKGIDHGLSLSEVEDGGYRLSACPHSLAPEGSLGKGIEYFTTDPGQDVIFTIQDGEITIQ